MPVNEVSGVNGTDSLWNVAAKAQTQPQKHVWDNPCWFADALGFNGNTVGNAAQN